MHCRPSFCMYEVCNNNDMLLSELPVSTDALRTTQALKQTCTGWAMQIMCRCCSLQCGMYGISFPHCM